MTNSGSAGPAGRHRGLLPLVRGLAAVLLLAGLLGAAPLGPPAAAGAPSSPVSRSLPRPSGWPLAGVPVVLRGFDPPADRYGAGHRGVDLAGSVGEPVLAAAAGTVSFAGRIGGLAAVTVDHGGVRTTYTPVRASVGVGARVDQGQPVGTLQAGHCRDLGAGAACLHWGLLRGTDYLDPLLLVPPSGPTGGYRLVPATERSAVLARERAARSLRTGVAAELGIGSPVPGGERVAPVGHWTAAGAQAAVAFAFAQLGRPYVFGATGPTAFDCSGLTMRAWEAGGVELGHYTGVQWTHLQPIAPAGLRPGDLVFWGTSVNPATIYHTAIYVGGGRIIQAPRPGRRVELSTLDGWIRPNFFARVPS